MTEKATTVVEGDLISSTPESGASTKIAEETASPAALEATRAKAEDVAARLRAEKIETHRTEVVAALDLSEKRGDTPKKAAEKSAPDMIPSPTLAASKSSKGGSGIMEKIFKGLWGVGAIASVLAKDFFFELMPKPMQEMFAKKEKKSDGKK